MALVLVVQLYETGTEGSASLLHSLIIEPLVLIPGLRRGVKRTPTEAVTLGQAVGGRLKHIMGCGDLKSVNIKIFVAFARGPLYLGVQCRQKFLLRIPCSVYPTPAGLFSAGNGDGVSYTLGGCSLELLGLSQMGRL